MMSDRAPLAHCGVLVTRPVHQAQKVQRYLEILGATPFLFPTLDIQPVKELTSLSHIAEELDQWDRIIFTSVNAVWHSMSVLSEVWSTPPPQLKIVAIGESTACALADYHWQPHLTPSKRYSSEGLLDLKDFQQIKNQRILIISGANGRSYLKDQLKKAGATVENCVVYHRQCPQVDVKPLIHYWEAQRIQCVMITSGDGLKNLIELLGSTYAHYWKETPLCVISERLAQVAREKGAQRLLVAQTASDEGMVEALLAWYEND